MQKAGLEAIRINVGNYLENKQTTVVTAPAIRLKKVQKQPAASEDKLDQLRARIRNLRLLAQPTETFLTHTDIGQTPSAETIQ